MKVNSTPNGNIDFSDIVIRVLQGDTLAPFLFVIWPDYVRWISIDLMKENSFTLNKAKCRQYPAETISEVDYTDDLELPANAPVQEKSLLHFLEQAVRSIDQCKHR